MLQRHNISKRQILIGLISLALWLYFSYWGLTTQMGQGFALQFSTGNICLSILSVLFFISLIQYILLNDKAIEYYVIYLVFSIGYIHYSVFYKNNQYVLDQDLLGINYSSGLTLLITYWLYSKFILSLILTETTDIVVTSKIKLCSNLFLFLIIIRLLGVLVISDINTNYYLGYGLLALCIPISIYGIGYAIITVKNIFVYIFFIGSVFYLVGSVLGFLISFKLIQSPFDNMIMREWTFYTQTGILMESIFFSIGFAYRMKMVEEAKNKFERSLYQEKLKELQYQNTLLKQRESISHDLHDNVGSTLNSIAVYSEIVKQKIHYNDPEVTPLLNKIGNVAQELVTTLNDIVWAVNPKNDQFENIILKMKLFASDLLMAQNVTIDFQVDESLNDYQLTIEKRKHFYLIFKEAINNVYKYAKCTYVMIHIYQCENNICMEIKDNGIGLDIENVRYGNGLQSMQERSKAIGGSINIVSQLHEGVSIQLSFPWD